MITLSGRHAILLHTISDQSVVEFDRGLLATDRFVVDHLIARVGNGSAFSLVDDPCVILRQIELSATFGQSVSANIHCAFLTRGFELDETSRF